MNPTFDIIEWLDEAAIPYTTAGKNVSSGWVGIACPFCDDHSNHCGINLESKLFSCFRCGSTGNIHKLIMQIQNCSFGESVKIVKKYDTGILPPIPPGERRSTQIDYPFQKTILPPYAAYLESRNFPLDVFQRFHLACSGPIGKFRLRIIIPFFFAGRIVTYVGRDITGQAPTKYMALSAEESIRSTKETLYNIDNARHNVLVCEGPTDVWRIGDGAVAIAGVKYSTTQIQLLSNFHKVNILFDNEIEAQKRAEKLALDLAPFTNVEVVSIPDMDDPATLAPEQVRELREEFLGD